MRDKGANERRVRSDGRAKASSKSSSMVVGSALAGIFGIAATLIVDAPSSSSSSNMGGGRMVVTWEGPSESFDLAALPATTACALAPPVFPKSISTSQSSSSSLPLSSSASVSWWRGSPSGRSKSASVHSSRADTNDGGGIVFIVLQIELRSCRREK